MNEDICRNCKERWWGEDEEKGGGQCRTFLMFEAICRVLGITTYISGCLEFKDAKENS